MPSVDADDAVRAVVALEHEMWAAAMRGDVDFLASKWADDFVQPKRAGGSATKEEVVATHVSFFAETEVRAYEVHSVHARRLAADVVLVTYIVVPRFARGGRQFEVPLGLVSVWENRAAEWVQTFHWEVPVGEPPL